MMHPPTQGLWCGDGSPEVQWIGAPDGQSRMSDGSLRSHVSRLTATGGRPATVRLVANDEFCHRALDKACRWEGHFKQQMPGAALRRTIISFARMDSSHHCPPELHLRQGSGCQTMNEAFIFLMVAYEYCTGNLDGCLAQDGLRPLALAQ